VRTRSKSPADLRSPTIHDVATAAGVSSATVSNVLRGTRYVGPELQQRVQDAIAALQYIPNSVAASLRERRSRTIGVVVPDITMGLFPAIVRRLAKRAAFTDYQLILTDSQEDPAWEQERVHTLIRRKVDGLIVIPCRDDSPVLEEVRQSGIPTVLLDRVAEGTDFDHVLLDNVAGAREGTRHLISLGHRHILLLASDPSLRNVRERIEGYREALAEAALSGCENVLIAGRNEAEHARQALMPLLASASRPSALFAVTQTMTIGALQTIWEAGLELPKDVSLLAFDDCEWFTALKPFVSTLRQPTDDFADQAWAMLMARLNGDRSPTLQSEVHCTLVIRESTIKYAAKFEAETLSKVTSFNSGNQNPIGATQGKLR
jgi:LacI family transcriptional regulator